jgi:uncharacterized protein YndB with AHSA1/START domain
VTKHEHELNVTAPGESEIVMERVFDAPRALVFDAFTKPELIKRWLLGPDGWSMPVCDVDLRAGGAFRYEWHNDTDADARDFGVGGTYREIGRPERIVHVERMDGMPGEALVTTTFSEDAGATTVTMRIDYGTREIRDMVLETGMDTGVATSYDRLEAILGQTPA